MIFLRSEVKGIVNRKGRKMEKISKSRMGVDLMFVSGLSVLKPKMDKRVKRRGVFFFYTHFSYKNREKGVRIFLQLLPHLSMHQGHLWCILCDTFLEENADAFFVTSKKNTTRNVRL